MAPAAVSPNDVFRFALELAALAAVGYWGLSTQAGLAGVARAVGGVLVVAVLWGVFRVPDDPGPAPVAVPGPARLLLELALFGGAAGLLALAGEPLLAAALAGLVLVHYALARRRVRWLLGR